MTSIPRRPSARITILPFVISVVLVYLNCCSAPFGALNNPYDAKNPSYVAVTGVSLNATTLSLSVGGGSSTLTATIAPSNATGTGVTWSSSAPSVGTVNSNGVVSPVTVGTTTIAVTTTDGGKTATCAVMVTATPSTPAMPTGVSASAGNAQVTISWTAVSGATSYNLYWSTTSGVTKTSGTKITGVTSPYTQTGLTNGTTYYYVVTAVTAGGESAASNQASATPQVPTPSIQMVSIPAGSFNNGTSVVTLSAFHMSEYDITQSQYQAMTGTNPSYFSSNADAATCPVEQVTWYDAVEFCNKLSSSAGLTPVYTITGRTPATGYPITSATVTADFTQNGYRLPTEAQWEYACRAGTTTTFFWGNTSGDPDATTESYAWYASNSNNTTHGVGQKLPNPWGLYDIVGDVWQWCWDWYGTYPSGPQTNPTGPSSGAGRVIRGGSWDYSSDYLASAFRNTTSTRPTRTTLLGSVSPPPSPTGTEERPKGGLIRPPVGIRPDRGRLEGRECG